MSTRASALLSAIATGILLFLLWDVLAAGIEPVEAALTAAALEDSGTWIRFAALAAIFVVSFTVGLMSLVYFNEVVAKRRRRTVFTAPGPQRSRSTRRSRGRSRRPSRSR